MLWRNWILIYETLMHLLNHSQMYELVNKNFTMNVKMIFMDHSDLNWNSNAPANTPAFSTYVAALSLHQYAIYVHPGELLSPFNYLTVSAIPYVL